MPFRRIDKQVKEIALDLIVRGLAREEIADLLQVSVRSIQRWENNQDLYDSVIPPPLLPQGRPRILPYEVLDNLYILLTAEPSTYLMEMQNWLTTEHDIALSLSAIQKNLTQFGLTHKKLTTLAKERNDNRREEWITFVNTHFFDHQIICTDESYKDARTHTRHFGWAMRGEIAFELSPFIRGERYSILPALTVDGFIALTVIEGSVDGDAFAQFIINDVVSILCS
jgi:transposase